MQLNKNELRRLADALEKLEAHTIYSQGWKQLSGAWAKAEMFDYDEDIIDVELKFGIQDGEQDVQYTETLKINRKTMEVID